MGCQTSHIAEHFDYDYIPHLASVQKFPLNLKFCRHDNSKFGHEQNRNHYTKFKNTF